MRRLGVSAQAYVEARERATGKQVWLAPPLIRKLDKLDKILSDLEIQPREYIQHITLLWEQYSKEQGMDYPTVDLVCGLKALQRYAEAQPADEEACSEAVLLYIEYRVCEYMILAALSLEGRETSDSDIEEIRSEYELLTSTPWKSIDETQLTEVRRLVCCELAAVYGVKSEDESYEELTTRIVEHRRGNLHR